MIFPFQRFRFCSEDKKPLFSIIVAVRDKNGAAKAASHAEGVRGVTPFELLTVEGSNPSSQRNFGAHKADGEFLVFWDDDSRPLPDYFVKLWNRWSESPEVIVVGGPALPLVGADEYSLALSFFFSSRIGAGPFAGRYRREAPSKGRTSINLILCNLSIRRSLFLQNGGFSPWLYPQEENEFLSRVSGGSGFFYDPSIAITRELDLELGEFSRKLFSYGWGRGRRMVWFPSLSSLALSGMIAFLVLLCIWQPLALGIFFSTYILVVAAGATIIGGSVSAKIGALRRRWVVLWCAVLFPIGHFSYGFGALAGALSALSSLGVSFLRKEKGRPVSHVLPDR